VQCAQGIHTEAAVSKSSRTISLSHSVVAASSAAETDLRSVQVAAFASK
jgi:hypothetical protein